MRIGHNEIAAMCREELERVGRNPALYDKEIYDFAAGWNGGPNEAMIREWWGKRMDALPQRHAERRNILKWMPDASNECKRLP